MLLRDLGAEFPQMALEVAHQHVLGVLAEASARSRSRVIVVSSSAVHGPRRAQARLDRPEARQPVRLAQRREPAGAEVDRVELQAERGARLVVGAVEVGRRRRLGGQRRARRPRSPRR